MTFKLGNLGISTFAGENTSDDFLLNGKNTNSNSGQDKFTVPPKVSVQARSDEDPIELHKRMLLEAASRAGLDDTTEQADFVRTHADGKISFTEDDPSPQDSAQVKKGEIKSGSVNYTLGDKELADLKLLQSVYAATNGNKLHKGRSYQSAGNAATNSRQTTEAFEKRKLEQLWRDAQLPTNSVFGTPSKLRDLKHVSLTVPDAKPVDADRALRLYIRDRYGDRLNSDSRDVLFDLAKQRGIRIENLTLENGQADFDISVESLLKLQHTYIGVQEKVNAELKIAQSVVDNLPHNRFAKGVFEGAWEDLKANWKMVSDPVGTIKGLYEGVGTLAKAGVMLAQMKPQDRQALFLQLAAAGIKGLAEMPVADAAEALGKLVGAGAVELALGKGVGVALKALRGTQFGAALIADAMKIAGELKQSIGKIPIPVSVNAVEIAMADGSRIRMPTVETKNLSQIVLEMRSTATTAGGTKAITKGTLEHIFHGEVNKKGNAVGFHSDIGEMQAINQTKIVEGTRSIPDKNGVYTAKVEVKGVAKTTNSGQSTFFPDKWSKADVVSAINEAYINKSFPNPKSSSYFEGRSSSGVLIGGYLKTDGTISTAFPLLGR